MKNIKIAVFKYDELDLDWDFRLEDLSDREFYRLASKYGKIYSVRDFQYLWNNVELDYNSDNSYFRIIDMNNRLGLKIYENKKARRAINENEDVFDAEKCLRQLIKNRLLDKFNPSKYEIWEYAEMAEEAAEDAGFPIEDAELLYDYLMDGFVHYYDSFVLYLRNIK